MNENDATAQPNPPRTPSDRSPAAEAKPGRTIDAGQGRVFPCQGCGADLVFHVGQQRQKCPYCGFEKELQFALDAEVAEQDLVGMLQRLREQRLARSPARPQRRVIRCDACGGSVEFDGSLTSTECPYCGSPVQLEDAHTSESRIPVDGMLAFRIERQEARERLAAWVRSRWFAPNEFLKRGIDGRFEGIYLPFWTFDALTFTRYAGERGEHYWVTVGTGDNKRRVRKTRWFWTVGSFELFFDDLIVPAVRRIDNRILERLEPWPLKECVPFNQQLLAGFLSRTYETELDEGFAVAQSRMEAAIEAEVRSRIGGDEQRIHSIRTQYGALSYKHLLLPVWLMVYRFRDRPYQVTVNAVTGEVQGQRPWSWIKITLAVLAAAIVVGGLWLLSQR